MGQTFQPRRRPFPAGYALQDQTGVQRRRPPQRRNVPGDRSHRHPAPDIHGGHWTGTSPAYWQPKTRHNSGGFAITATVAASRPADTSSAPWLKPGGALCEGQDMAQHTPAE
jgi:hypothetical protein